VVGLTRAEVDLEHPRLPRALREFGPEAVINAAAWTDVDACARDPKRAIQLNGVAPGSLARDTRDLDALFVQISTNEVFDGRLTRPYREDDEPNPVNPYGASKLAGERAVAAASDRHLIARTSWLFSTGDRTFPSKIRAAAERSRAAGRPVRVVADELGNPTWVPDLAAAIVRAVGIRLSADGPSHLHLAGWPPASRLEWARVALADMVGLEIEPIAQADYPRASLVPPRAILDVELARTYGIEPSDWRAATTALVRSGARA
jgi:dTDP-4-dehydrorhamnose reductase